MKPTECVKGYYLPLLATVLLLPLAATANDAQDKLSREEIAQHDNRDSCWLVIEGKVYDITSWIPNHPAPPAVILPWCGKEDATKAMRTKGYGQNHSDDAWERLDNYLIGDITDK